MLIERDANGDAVVDPAALAARFAVPPAEFRRYMQLGLVTSTVEVGVGDDAGTRRLSVRFGNRLWRAVIDAENKIQHEAITFVRGRSGERHGLPASRG